MPSIQRAVLVKGLTRYDGPEDGVPTTKVWWRDPLTTRTGAIFVPTSDADALRLDQPVTVTVSW